MQKTEKPTRLSVVMPRQHLSELESEITKVTTGPGLRVAKTIDERKPHAHTLRLELEGDQHRVAAFIKWVNFRAIRVTVVA